MWRPPPPMQLKGGEKMSVPNQNIVYIHKSNRQEPPFVSLNLKTMSAAYKELGNAFTFYLYLVLCCNQNGHRLEFSPQQIQNEFNMPVTTVRDQFKKLIEKKFLVQKNEGSNVYDFYAEPEFLRSEKIVVQAKTQESETKTSFNF